MIKANELRLGNWVKILGQYEQVTRFVKGSGNAIINRKSEDLIEPIPLTPEILEKAGFEVIYPVHNDKRLLTSRYCAFNENNRIVFDHNKRIIKIEINETDIAKPIFEHLHQLQNIYYALTGTELEINL